MLETGVPPSAPATWAQPSSSNSSAPATGYADAVAAHQSVGDLKGKVVIDITNPLTADYMGLTLGQSTSAAEEIAKAVPGADFGNGRKVSGFDVVDAGGLKNARCLEPLAGLNI